MTTGAALIAAAQTLLGQPYDDGSQRLVPSHVGTDCSGLIVRAYQLATGQQLGPVVSVTQYQACRDEGRIVTKAEAFAIPGALLFCPHDPEQGYGPNGHVGFSNGDGATTTESTPYAAGGVQVLTNTFQPWSDIAGLLPGIDYGQQEVDLTDDQAKQLAVIYNSQGSFNTILAAVNQLKASNAETHAKILAAPWATATNRKRIADLVAPI